MYLYNYVCIYIYMYVYLFTLAKIKIHGNMSDVPCTCLFSSWFFKQKTIILEKCSPPNLCSFWCNPWHPHTRRVWVSWTFRQQTFNHQITDITLGIARRFSKGNPAKVGPFRLVHICILYLLCIYIYILYILYLYMLAPVLGAREKTCIFENILIIM